MGRQAITRQLKAAYDKNFLDYKAANRSSGTTTIEALLKETYDTTKNLSQSVKKHQQLSQVSLKTA